MRLAFLLNDLQLSGGVGVVVEHARRLCQLPGWQVDLVLVREEDQPPWVAEEKLEGLRVLQRREALEKRYDLAVATWWETLFTLFELEADHQVMFIQSLEDRFYLDDQAKRIGAQLALSLPPAFITEARWIKALLGDLRPEAPVYLVRNGIDKSIFNAPDDVVREGEERLRVLVEGPFEVWFKRVPEAVDAVGEMAEHHRLTVVTNQPERPFGAAPFLEAVGPLAQPYLAERYRETDVLLKLSAVEGMAGPPLEAFHCGATAILTPVSGHEEYLTHGYNGLLCDWGDSRGVARLLDLLAANRRLLAYLRYNALRTARGWPSWDQAALFMRLALEKIAEEPQQADRTNRLHLARDLCAAIGIYDRHLQERADFARRALRFERRLNPYLNSPLGRQLLRARHHPKVKRARAVAAKLMRRLPGPR